MGFRRPKPYEHKEAFCLMLYRDTAGNEEWIWNSRDGVTPFCIESRQGLQAQHVDWHRDSYVPDYKPKPGERIFVDLTIERAREFRRRYVDQWWDNELRGNPMREFYPSREEAVEILVREDMGHSESAKGREGGGAPDLIEVTDAAV